MEVSLLHQLLSLRSSCFFLNVLLRLLTPYPISRRPAPPLYALGLDRGVQSKKRKAQFF